MVRLIYNSKCRKDNMYSDPAAIPQEKYIDALLMRASVCPWRESQVNRANRHSFKLRRDTPPLKSREADTDVLARMPVVCPQ